MLEFVFSKQKAAYELRISGWSSDVCSSDSERRDGQGLQQAAQPRQRRGAAQYRAAGRSRERVAGRVSLPQVDGLQRDLQERAAPRRRLSRGLPRSEERRVWQECVGKCKSRWFLYH